MSKRMPVILGASKEQGASVLMITTMDQVLSTEAEVESDLVRLDYCVWHDKTVFDPAIPSHHCIVRLQREGMQVLYHYYDALEKDNLPGEITDALPSIKIMVHPPMLTISPLPRVMSCHPRRVSPFSILFLQ